MLGIRRASFLTNPARHVSTAFVRFQWGNGSHCHECLNKPTLPRRSYGLLCLNKFSDKQARTTHDTKSNSEFPTVTWKKTTFHISLVSVECGATPFGADELKSRYGDDSTMCARYSRVSTGLFVSPRSNALNRVAVQAESPDPCSNRLLRDAQEIRDRAPGGPVNWRTGRS